MENKHASAIGVQSINRMHNARKKDKHQDVSTRTVKKKRAASIIMRNKNMGENGDILHKAIENTFIRHKNPKYRTFVGKY